MSAGLQQLKRKFANLSTRERNIIIILALVLIVFIFDQLLISPLQENNKITRQKINAMASQMSEQSAQTGLLSGAKDDPNFALKQKLESLQRTLVSLDNEIGQVSSEMIPPRKMTEILEQLLRENTRLVLVNVNTLPSEKVTMNGQADSSTSGRHGLFRHTVEIELQGGYFDTLRYLQAIEALPWKVFWRELDYRVEEYPKASIRLRLNTLSTHASWIGV